MTGLETALASVGLKVLGDELVSWLKRRGDDLSEDDWIQMGMVVKRKLDVDYQNIEASFLHKSRKPGVVSRIESAAQIYRELAIIGEERDFDEYVVDVYSDFADICSQWAIRTDGLHEYQSGADEFFELAEEYETLVG